MKYLVKLGARKLNYLSELKGSVKNLEVLVDLSIKSKNDLEYEHHDIEITECHY